MDDGPAVEPELDAFSMTLPLPYRVSLLLVLGIWGWGINLQTLYQLKIDVPSLIRYPTRSSPALPPHYRTTYRLAATASAGLAASLLLFWSMTRQDPARVLDADWLPMTTLASLILLLVLPLPRRLHHLLHPPAGSSTTPFWAAATAVGASLPQDGRRRLAAMLRRVAFGGLAEQQHGRFGDILLTDTITSYAKVLGDIFVSVCMFFTGAATDRPNRDCGGALAVPLIMAAPSAARLRQCLIEYVRARRAREPAGQHLANALKYFSAFPVIVLSAMQVRPGEAQDAEQVERAASLHRAWLVAVLVNSLYSFYWDVSKDWDLTFFTPQRAAPGQPWGLRRRLYMQPAPGIYYGVASLDLVLRCTWSLKLSPHLGRLVGGSDFERSLFVMEFFEVLRRWIWIFFRVETEWIRSTNSGPVLGLDDVMLGEYPDKYDDDG